MVLILGFAPLALAHHPDDVRPGPSLLWGPGQHGNLWFAYQDPRFLVHGAITPDRPKSGESLRVELIARQSDEAFPGSASVTLRRLGESTSLVEVACRQLGPGTYQADLALAESGDFEVRVALQGPGGRTVAVPIEVSMGVPWIPFAVLAGVALAWGAWRIRRARTEELGA